MPIISSISLSALDGTNGFKLMGVSADDLLGVSVSNAGDVNGDGFDDIIVGAEEADPSGSTTGASYLVFGKSSGFSSNLDLASLNGTDGTRISGVSGGDRSGGAVSAAGDVNGDGFDDLIIGSRSASHSALTYAGVSYLVFGNATGFGASLSLSGLASNVGIPLQGAASFDRTGFSVSSAGDLNADGFADVVIGSPDARPNGSTSGAAYVVFGTNQAFNFDLSALNGTTGFRLVGVASADQTGSSVSSAGDVNGDGIGDLLVGARNAGTGGNNGEGAAFVVFGKTGGFASSVDLAALNGSNGFRLSGSGNAGSSVSNAGDFNGDGYADLVIGAPQGTGNGYSAGVSYVVFGKPQAFAANLDLSGLNGNNGFQILGAVSNDRSGISVSSAGDVNGDGFDDLLIGAERSTANGALSGTTYLVYGRASGLGSSLQLSSLDGTNGFRLLGKDAGDRSGHSVSAAGDVNGDGFDDLLIGAYKADRDAYNPDAGASYVVFGGNFTDAVIVLGSSASESLAGTAGADRIVAGQGNDTITGGGGADVINAGAGSDRIVVATTDFMQVDGGSGVDTLVLADGALTLDLTAIANSRIRGIERIDMGGTTQKTLRLDALDVIALSDDTDTLRVDSNGQSGRVVSEQAWVLAGGELFESTSYNIYTNGRAELRLENALTLVTPQSTLQLSSLDGLTGFRISGVDTGDQSGGAVSNAGDVNGDGFDDLLIGGVLVDGISVDSGAGYVVFGGSGGFASNLDLSALNGSNGFRLAGVAFGDGTGYSLGAAGDVNGDGFADIIIGASGADVGVSNTGAAYVVYGKANGFAASLNLSTLNGSDGFQVGGEGQSDLAGVSASGAGDVNGDGYDDIIIGAFGDSNYGQGSGAAFVVFGAANGLASTIGLNSVNGQNGFKIQGASAFDQAGFSVSSAGDMNGDGFDDMIIGARRVDANFVDDSGASYVVFGKESGFPRRVELSTLDGTNGFRVAGQGQDSYSGNSVSSAGDVNGDGFDDIIIGAAYADSPIFNAGAAYVLFGKAGGFASSVAVSVLSGSDGFRLAGAADSDKAGMSVSRAGDVNGDGYDDLIVGANYADPNGASSGAAYLVFGHGGSFAASFNLSALNGVNGTRLAGVAAGDTTGDSVSAAGDVNGDGFDDLIIGANGASPNGAGSGASYVVFGGFFTGAVTYVGGPTGGSAIGTSAAESFVGGHSPDSIAGGGGADSFSSGAADDRISIADTTFARVDGGSGKDTLALAGSGITLDLGVLRDNRINGIEVIDLTGSGNNTVKFALLDVRQLSDTSDTLRVDGNAGDRVVTLGWTVGGTLSANSNTYRIYSQGTTVLEVDEDIAVFNPLGTRSLSELDGSNGFRLGGVAAYDLSGQSVSGAGDINGDGFDDVIIGAPGADPHYSYSGASYVVFGKATGFTANLNLSALNGQDGFKLSGAAQNDRSGVSVSGAGDFNGDGFGDFLVGSKYADPASNSKAGISYLVFGKTGGFSAILELSELDGTNGFQMAGVAADEQSGFAVSGAGDVNGDGLDDLIVGAPTAAPNGAGTGASYVVFGHASVAGSNLDLSTLDGNNGFTISGTAANDYAGYSVSRAGDINADGFDDLILGALGADAPGGESGAAYVLLGKASGFAPSVALSSLNGSNGFKLSGGTAGDAAGKSVRGAGDVNGDGFADVIVGANGADNNGNVNAGASYVVFGKAAGFASTIELTAMDGISGFQLSGVNGSDNSGFTVSGAGDVNGDGFDDLLIGAYLSDSNGSNAGSTYVVLGKAGGFASMLNLSSLDGSNGYRLVGAAASNFSGKAVSAAGDVNGDGFDDLLVGAEDVSANGNQSGATYVIFGGNFSGAATAQGTAGADTVGGAATDDVLVGGSGSDLINALTGNDIVQAGAGNDTVDGGEGNDRIEGDAGNDSLSGSIGFDTIYGGDGNDHINGANNADRLYGGDGNDSLFGGKSADLLSGGNGDDVLSGQVGNDSLYGGNGRDTADYSAGDAVSVNLVTGVGGSTVSVVGVFNGTDILLSIESVIGSAFADSITGDLGINVLTGGAGNDTLSSSDGPDTLFGGDGDDVIAGGAGGDSILGGIGSDIISGGKGGDRIFGEDGDDTLNGNLGNDQMTGGAGADKFIFNSVLSATTNVDTILDFQAGVDVIQLSATIFTAFNTQVGQTIGTNTNLLYDNASGVLSYDADGAGGNAATNFAIIGSGVHPGTMGNDFLIIA